MTITIRPAAAASAGGNQTIWAHQATQAWAARWAAAPRAALWTSSGSGTFGRDATTLNAPILRPRPEISAGTVTLTLATTGEQGPCTPAAAQVVVTINALPAITVFSANVTVCAGSPAIFCVTATGTALTYQWQVSGDGGVTFTNSSHTATNACYTKRDHLRWPTTATNTRSSSVGACTPALYLCAVGGAEGLTRRPRRARAATRRSARATARRAWAARWAAAPRAASGPLPARAPSRRMPRRSTRRILRRQPILLRARSR